MVREQPPPRCLKVFMGQYFLLGLLGLLAFDMLMGLRESRARWREVASGRAGIYTLRMLTGISDRHELTRRFGTPDSTFHYVVSPDQMRAARTTARRIFDQKWIESTLLGLVVLAGAPSIILGSTGIGLVIVCGVAFYRCFVWAYTLLVLARCYRQMLEEGRAKLQYSRDQAT